MALTYLNKKGQTVTLTVTIHAMQQFQTRWKHVNMNEPKPADWELELQSVWERARNSRIKNLNKQEKTRLDRYGKDTLYFRCGVFQFVVQDACLITVELCGDEETRALNKKPPPRPILNDEGPRYRLSMVVFSKGLTRVINSGYFRTLVPENKILSNKFLVEQAVAKALAKKPELKREDIVSIRLWNVEAGENLVAEGGT